MNWLATFLALILVTTLYAANPYDPGKCTEKKRGNFVVVKDRNDDDQIVVCVQRHGRYRWDMINGNSYGSFIEPAKDCSDVVDNVPKAKTGVYWIRTSNGPQKAWCDVDTDKGGFLLIGVQDTPNTLTIPSGTSFIDPRGPAAWSSAFGDKNVLDFRVQISRSKDFRHTRAHWYYRFNSPRVLSKLLMSNEGGCGHQYAGIGNIAFVKELMSGKIMTRNFNCSRFSSSKKNRSGWEKMNKCFKEVCPVGFAYCSNRRIDKSGSYSYSVVNGCSGIEDTQTSFVGCDRGKCCACFGPDSKQDYCAPKCRAINGGTVLKEKDNITVWFWIRSSLPKRVWKKCMEFKEKNSAGKLKTWRVEDGVRRKGPCSASEDVTINDGVVVVANNRSMNKLPKLNGLLSYRTDDRNLYLKENSRWKALVTQKDIKDVLSRLEKVDKKLMDANKVTLGELDKVDKKLTSADQTTLAKLDRVNKNLTNVDKAILDKLDKADRKLISINQATLDKLDKVKLNLTNADKATLGKLDKVIKNLTNTDTATFDKLDNVDERLSNINQATLEKLDRINKNLTNADKVTLEKFDKVDKKLTNADKVTLDKLEEVDKKLTNADTAILDKLDKVDKKLTNADTTTLDKLDKVDKKLSKANQAILEKLDTVNKNLTNADNVTLAKLQKVDSKLTKVDKDVEILTHESCRQIWKSQSNKGSGVYRITTGNNEHTSVYCQMSSISGCDGGGWTLVMKIDGRYSTFRYDSFFWSSKGTYNDNSYGRDGGLDNRQYKGSTYWKTSFKEICVAMKYNGNLRAFSFSYPASSLYSLIADGRYRQTHLGRNKWKSLISGSSLQRNCNREGFNAQTNGRYSNSHAKVRLGLIANEQNDCVTPDSFIGLGGGVPEQKVINPAGNSAKHSPDNGEKNLKAMGYILVR